MKHLYLKCLFLGILSFLGIKATAYNCRVNGIYYNLNKTDSTASVTYYSSNFYWENYNAYTGNETIPSTFIYEGITYRVTSIGRSAFCQCILLSSVTIPESVTSIGDWAFDGCSDLTSIEIPSSVTSIGRSAFSGTAWYNNQPDGLVYAGNVAYNYKGTMPANTSIILKEGTLGIASWAFRDCSNLTSIEIPNSVTSIGEDAFSMCSGLTSVIIPNGVTSIGEDAFYKCSGLTSVIIPNSVTSIGESAFDGCSSLTSIEIPNSVTSIGEDAFYGCISLTSVTISNSVTIIESGTFAFCSGLTSVIIPNGVILIDQYAFRDCSGLNSLTLPSSLTYIMHYAFTNCSDITTITIYNLNPPTLYSSVFNSNIFYNATLYVPAKSLELYETAKIWNNFKNIMPFDDIGTSFTLNVIDEQNQDLTNEVNIVWYDSDGKQIGTGNSLNGIDEDTDIFYSVLLDEELGRVYREVEMQKVDEGESTITCKLEKIGRVMLEGRVIAADIDKNTATVSVKQMLNGKYEENYQTQTNEQGVFQVEVYDDEADITISGDGFFDATLHRDGFGGNGNIGTIPLNLITGFTIAANINIEKAVATGESEEMTLWTEGLNNIEFSLFNTTKNKDIIDFTVQNGNVFIRSGADVGDEICLVAKSKQSLFTDATTSFILEEGAKAFNLQLTERGGIDAVCELSNNAGTSGYLYNSDGVLVSMGSYIGETLEMRHIPAGIYTLVSIGRSLMLGSMTNLTDLVSVGLSESEDFVATRVEVVDGEITEVSVNEVPRLEENKFYYTTNNTYFNADKPSITAGNYLTLSAHLDFKPECAGKMNGVTLSIDLPEGCQMVKNSAIVNGKPVLHSVNGKQVSFVLTPEQYQNQLRFCIIPSLNKNYIVTAIASFDKDGKVQQPIGTAQFEAKGLSLSVPQYAASSNVTISGTANGHSEVSIYDNEVLIGKTTSKADGTWTTEAELFKPRSHSFHDIYAKIITENGMELTSESKIVEFNKNNLVPEKVTMTYYNGWYKENKIVEFNLLKGITTPSSYPFYQGTDFTFLADFTRNDTTQIKDVYIKVLNSDGSVRMLPAIFDGKQNHWVATTKYSSANRLPQNVTLEYIIMHNTPIYDEEMEEEMNNLVNNMWIEVENAYKDCDIEIISEDSNSITFMATTNGYETKENFKITFLDYDQVKAEYANELVCHIVNDTTDISFVVNDDDTKSGIVVWDNITEYAFDISTGDNVHANMSKKRRIVPFIIGAGWGIFESVFEYNKKKEIITMWRNILKTEIEMRNKWYKNMVDFLYKKCSDGSYKIKDANTRKRLQEEVDNYSVLKQKYISDFKILLDKQQQKLKNLCTLKGTTDVMLSTGGAIIRGSGKIINLAKGKILQETGKKLSSFDLAVHAINEEAEQGASHIFGSIIDIKDNLEKDISNWYQSESDKLTKENARIVKSIRSAYSQCEEDDENEDDSIDDLLDFMGKGSIPILDPSGYVYEAVLSNRLEDVTTTCYQQENGETVLWNAEDYSQKNPLKTDKAGFYRWDVPQGMWQVKYEKEGYETAYSEWLPVPPPQLDVNVGMKQSTPPTVTQIRGYESGITIDLSKYMLPASLNETNITVTRNGFDEKGHIELINEEKEPKGEQTFASKVKFVPEALFNSSDLVVITVHKEVESYCGVNMVKDHVETVKIESEIKSIVADSVITIPYQSEQEIRVLVLPKEASTGKTLYARTSSQMIASLNASIITLDQDGAATLMLGGELPGGAVIDFSVEGADVTATSKVKVVIGRDLVATPTASIQSGETINSGTLLVLNCATDGATIYYTLDGSCPCDEATRIRYDGPITIATDVIVKAIAVKEGMDDSDVATFVYMVNGINHVLADNNIRIDSKDKTITITGAEGASCQIYDLQGRLFTGRSHMTNQSRFKMKSAGIYLLQITLSNGQVAVGRVLVK